MATKIKLHDWNVKQTGDEECTVSFKLSNVIGAKWFAFGFEAIKGTLEESTSAGFSSTQLVSGLSSSARHIYDLLKTSKHHD